MTRGNWGERNSVQRRWDRDEGWYERWGEEKGWWGGVLNDNEKYFSLNTLGTPDPVIIPQLC